MASRRPVNRLVGASLAVLVCVGGCGPDAGPSSGVAAPSGFRRAVPVAPSAPQAGSAEAEQVAMSITTAVIDRAVGADMPALVKGMACVSMPAGDRDALIREAARQDEAASDRRWSPGADRWLRSRAVDDAVVVEIAGVIELHDGFVAWHRFRVDVQPRAGGWCIDGVAAEPVTTEHGRMPDAPVPDTTPSIRDSLDGPGWRTVPDRDVANRDVAD